MIPQVLALLTKAEQPPWLHQLVATCSDSVPAWVFVQWQPQLLALQTSGCHGAVGNTVKRLSQTYPQAMLFPIILADARLRQSGEATGQDSGLAFAIKAIGPLISLGNRLIRELDLLHDPILMATDLKNEFVGFRNEP